MRAQESLALTGSFDKELQELLYSDISQAAVKEYRDRYPNLGYIYHKLKELGLLYELGIVANMTIKQFEDMSYSINLEKEIKQFQKWKPDYSIYDNTIKHSEINKSTKSVELSALSILQGARVSQIEQLKVLTQKRLKETKLYYMDDGAFEVDEDVDMPYQKFLTIMKMIENGQLKDHVKSNFKLVRKPYSFTQARYKAEIDSKRWTTVVRGIYPLNYDLYVPLVLAFYLGINSLEEIESFFQCFGASLYSPTELINNVPVEYIRNAIEAGMHYDNIIYYLKINKM